MLRLHRHRPASRKGEAGFSLPEVLIAALILLFVILGVIPLFVRAMMSNTSGKESSNVSNAGKSSVEEYFGVDFNAPQLVNAGPNVAVTVLQHQEKHTGNWLVGARDDTGLRKASEDTERTIRVSQHSLSDLLDDGVLNAPFAAPAPVSGSTLYPVHLKQIEVEIIGQTAEGPLAGSLNKRIFLRTLRGF